jgi:hypothetical protein
MTEEERKLVDIIDRSEFLYSDSHTTKAGVTLSLESYRINGKTFTIVVNASHSFKVRGTWNTNRAGSSDGLRPEVRASYWATVEDPQLELRSIGFAKSDYDARRSYGCDTLMEALVKIAT